MMTELLDGLATADVARACHVTPSHVRHWRAGRRQISLGDLETILDMRTASVRLRTRAKAWWEGQERARRDRRQQREAAAS